MHASHTTGVSVLRVVAREDQPSGLEQRIRIDRPLVYERIMGVLGGRVRAAHKLMVERGDVLPNLMPRDRPLQPEEVDELVWRVYCLISAMRLSFVRCHPTVVRLGG